MLPSAADLDFYGEDEDRMSEEIIEASTMECSENLPDVVAGMELLTVDSENGEVEPARCSRYSMRSRVQKTATTETLNRRCRAKPKKRCSTTELLNKSEIYDYYLDKNFKKNQKNTLETIYEEIDGMSENATLISKRKLCREIKFSETKAQVEAKIRKRRAKIKRAFGSRIRAKPKAITMNAFLKKLEEIKAQQSAMDT